MRSAASRSAPSGCGGRSAPCRRSTGIDRAAAARRRRARARPLRGLLARSCRDARAARPRTACRSCPSGSPRTPTRRPQAAGELGFPAVVKSAAAGAHKTETGGVALDLEDEAAVRAAAERIGFPVIVQPMLRGGTELLAGLVQDPVFGPLVAFGPGGVFAELIGEASLRIAPLTDIDADELVTSGQGRPARPRLPRRRALPTRRRSSTSSTGSRARRRPARGRRARPQSGARLSRSRRRASRVRIRRPQEQRREKRCWGREGESGQNETSTGHAVSQ